MEEGREGKRAVSVGFSDNDTSEGIYRLTTGEEGSKSSGERVAFSR